MGNGAADKEKGVGVSEDTSSNGEENGTKGSSISNIAKDNRGSATVGGEDVNALDLCAEKQTLTEIVAEIQKPRKKYLLRDTYKNFGEQENACKRSCYLYVGNLSFFTSEDEIHGHFSKVGDVIQIIMGLNKNTKKPCGFCFVQYATHHEAVSARRVLNTSVIDGRIIKVEVDPGFVEGRQFGRGGSGGQVRDDMRKGFDDARGGEGGGLAAKAQLDAQLSSRRWDPRGGPRGPMRPPPFRGGFRGRGGWGGYGHSRHPPRGYNRRPPPNRNRGYGGRDEGRGMKRGRNHYDEERPSSARPQKFRRQERDVDDDE